MYDVTVGPIVALHRAGMEYSKWHPGGYGWGILKAAGRGVLDSMNSEEDAAAESLRQKNYLEFAGHHVAAAIPMLGPLVAQIAQEGGHFVEVGQPRIGDSLLQKIGGDIHTVEHIADIVQDVGRDFRFAGFA